MQPAVEGLIADFRQRGIRLIADPPKLSVEPASRLTDTDRALIRAHKLQLLARLTAEHEQSEIDRIGRLDAERREADRLAKRGYDFDPTAPSHAEYVARTDPLADLGHPAYAILRTCQRYGVALRIDPDGALVVGRAGAKADEPSQPWPSLIRAIEAHIEAVARLVEAGWTVRADFTGPVQ